MKQLLTGKQLCEYLGIEADTLRRIRKEDPAFPGFFFSKYYSKPEIDAWLRSRINQQQKINSEIDIETESDMALNEIFGTGPFFSPSGHASRGERARRPAPLKLAE